MKLAAAAVVVVVGDVRKDCAAAAVVVAKNAASVIAALEILGVPVTWLAAVVSLAVGAVGIAVERSDCLREERPHWQEWFQG